MKRREFLTLAALGGGVAFASGFAQAAAGGGRYARRAGEEDFYFVQLSDVHWGYEGPANPEARKTLPKVVDAVNRLSTPPAFIVFTGDLTHTTDDVAERRKRMKEFNEIISGLNVKTRYFMPGEHDASFDQAGVFKEFFGETHYGFSHGGINFVVIDNVSEPAATIGDTQIEWLRMHLGTLNKNDPLVVFTHRPLFPLVPKWDWTTLDGSKAIELLMPFPNVTVFYGHIHQEYHFATEHIQHHSAKSLIFPLPAPGSQEKRAPLAWDSAQPFKGLGFRMVEKGRTNDKDKIIEFGVT